VQLVADQTAATVIQRARERSARALLESDGYVLAAEIGIATPAHVVADSGGAVTADLLARLSGSRVVIKAQAHDLPHKSASGGVVVVERTPDAVSRAVNAMTERLADVSIESFLIAEHVAHADRPGAQLLIGFRNTPDLGPVVTVGPGGVLAEVLAGAMDGGRASAVFAPRLHSRDQITQQLRARTLGTLLSRDDGGSCDSLTIDDAVALILRLLAFAESDAAREIEELEFNPVVRSRGAAVALDALVRLAGADHAPAPAVLPRPLQKLDALLHPRRAAIVGVSRSMNPGRVILENMLALGFPADDLAVVKPGETEIAGVRCYPSIDALPEKVDLCIVSLAAPDVPSAIDELVHHDRAEGIVVVSGGIGERSGTDALETQIRETIADARRSPGCGPVVNGANCLGVRSVTGHYDATFIPQYKRPELPAESASLAIVAQSGAFMISRCSKLLGVNPRYMISVGNQVDLTVGDYLAFLESDSDVRTVACYIEGFRPGDGRQWLEAAARLTRAGREVIVYRAGRTPAGAKATVSHTAAIAGDYLAFRELAESTGVLVADALEDFDDLVRLHCYLEDKNVDGLRLGAFSNAGFECVAAADHLGPFSLSEFSPATETQLASILAEAGLGAVVAPRNPVDVTPMLDDEPFAAAVQAMLADAAVDIAVVGCGPLTPALHTLEPAASHTEDVTTPTGVAPRLAHLHGTSRKAWVVVVDAGPMYDAMTATLLAARVPVFRTVDRALTIFGKYCAHRLRRRVVASTDYVRPPGEH
jgi:acyl-CoA synthetase (NDP forming)